MIGPAALLVRGTGALLGRNAAARRRAAALADVATLCAMLRVALDAGASVASAVEAAARHVPPERDAGVGAFATDLERGRPLEDALDAWAERRGAPVDELAVVLSSAHRSGAAVVVALDRLGSDLRRRRRRSAEERARRLPVSMLLPLVLCVLPAFGLVTVVPTIAVGFERLSLAP